MHTIVDQEIINTLKKHSAYVTQNRIAVLKIFLQNHISISVSRIRKLSTVELDRISIYRTLQFFLKKGLIRMVPNSRGNPHYILTDLLQPSSLSSAKDHIVYFICTSCGHTELIEQRSAPVFNKPGNHKVSNCYVVMEGLCSKCK